MVFALAGATVFDGETFHDGMAVTIEGRQIRAIAPRSALASGIKVIELAGGILAPGFIDVQVNGGGGALLNDHPSLEVVRTIADSHRRYGTVGMLPTVITDAPEVTAAAIAAVKAARAAGLAHVLGIHVEGPFLDPARKGAHDLQFIRAITSDDISRLATAECGKLMLTLAPNRVPPDRIRDLVKAGVLVSLGHSDADAKDVHAALAAGATSFTHLFNAMSQLTGREPGMVGAALADHDSFLGVIADGLHVHDTSLRLAFGATPLERFMLVTDAMPPAAGGPDVFHLQGREVKRINGKLQLADGTLAGSNLTMDEAVRYAVQKLHVPLASALQMASRNPARFLGLQDHLGVIRPGALASLVHVNEDLHVIQTWVEGQ
ncbi:N-acetylglucosamine-6-phosphate deacetylase [Aestuariivirga sp.]|uniref:N-acetylglucosamine-6-phosphate deacetylase n=1 Tax=Aestuariivirga sp. TaxID=2650926 RepID=UPI0039E729EA